MTNVLLLNGPPGCGKDSIAKELCRINSGQVFHEKFATPIREMICGLLGVSDDVLDSIKDEPQPFLDYATPREYMIAYSEDFIKPRLGLDVWGRALRQRIMKTKTENSDSIVIVSDAGFPEEVQAVIDSFGFSRVILIALYRKKCTFVDDSRDYVVLPQIGTYIMYNDGTIPDIVTEIQGIMDNWSL